MDPNNRKLVDVGCPCGQTHTVSFLGFLLLKEVGSRMQERILSVERVKPLNFLSDPILTALSSLVADQEGMVKKLDVGSLYCENKETAEAIATLVEQSETVMQDVDSSYILILGEIQAEGWAAIRRAVEHLSAAFGKDVRLDSERGSMIAGGKEDLKAIWDNVGSWRVQSDDEEDQFLYFDKDMEGGGWEGVDGQRRGLEAVIDMTEEEWLEELSKYGHTQENSEEEDEDSEEEDEMGEEEGEDPGPQ